MENTTTTGLMPLNLQYFAEEGSGEAEGTTATESGENTNEGADVPPVDLDAFLAENKALQSQFDKKVGKALATAQKRWEAEKNMTAEELAEAKAQEKLQELSQREQALVMKELRASAVELLGGKELPVELIDCVSLTDEASMQNSVRNAEKAFRAAVDKAVAERMKGYAPQSGSGDQTASHLAQVRANMGLK